MTVLTYVAVWPITDRTRPRAALITEACGQLDIMAELAGAKIVGEPQWSVSNNLLVCLVPVREWDPDSPQAVTPAIRDQIHRLALNDVSARQIALQVGVSTTTASRYAKQVR